MAWIKTIPLQKADGKLLELLTKQRELYPVEYALPAPKASRTGESIVESHTLIPDAMFHAFSTFGALLSQDLPLKRRQHEMIATMVSVINECHY
jgi:alkylhydroperoxidase family enzyme